MIERQVVEGQASSPAAFLEDAATRLVEDSRAEEDGIARTAAAGIEAGKDKTVATAEARIDAVLREPPDCTAWRRTSATPC